ERFEGALGDEFSQRFKEKLLTHERNSAADDDASRAKQCDNVGNTVSKKHPCAIKQQPRWSVAAENHGVGNKSGRDGVDISRCELVDCRLSSNLLMHELLGRLFNCPTGCQFLKWDVLQLSTVRFLRENQMPEL